MSDTSELPMHYYEKTKSPFYKTRRFWIICVVIVIVIVVILVPVLLLVAFPKIAQSNIDSSTINFDQVNITFTSPNGTISKRDGNDWNNTFTISMSGSLGNAGAIGATIDFSSPVTVSWDDNLLGSLTLPSVSISGGNGQLLSSTTFTINDTNVFGNFSKYLLSQPSFTWVLQGTVTVHALGRTIENLKLYKEVTLNGMNGFPDVNILEFNLPRDDPQGGIQMSIVTEIQNPSPISVQLGTIVLNIGYGSTLIGPVTGQNVVLVGGASTNITLVGRMLPQTKPTDLAQISDLMSRYISGLVSNTTAAGVSASPDGVHSVTWLSEGFQSVTLHVPLASTTSLQLITGITLGDMDLTFNAQTPYAPLASSDSVIADFKMPFGFTLNITQVEQNMTIATFQDGGIAALQSTWGNATSNQGAGILTFKLNAAPLQVFSGKEQAFNGFTGNLTLGSQYNFSVIGNATVGASTPIGNVILSHIPFNATTSLQGLRGLNSTATVINSLDVTGGSKSYLSLGINVAIVNPSNLQISTGDVNFHMITANTTVGDVILQNLTLARGTNTLNAVAEFDPNTSDAGKQLLTSFLAGQNAGVNIEGFNGTSNIASLVGGLSQIELSSTLPGLKSKLVANTSLVVLSDTATTSNAQAYVVINNPFSAGLSIVKISSAISYSTMPVGDIVVDISSNPIVVSGKSSASSSALPLKLNTDPTSVALLLRENAKSTGLDIKPLDALLTMGGFKIGDSVSPDPSLFQGFNLVSYVEKALANLHIDLELDATVEIGQYTTDLQYVQTDIPCHTDSSVAFLIPIVGQPIVQTIVNEAVLAFTSVEITSTTASSFKTQLVGSISNTGPISALIQFTTPLTISWNNRKLGTLTMSSIQTTPGQAATINTNGDFTITDTNAMADFTAYMLANDGFDWQIDASGLNVTALGYSFLGLTLSKSVHLKGMSGFKDDVAIQSFALPSNDQAGGISMSVQISLKNPSNVGVQLSVLSFATYFGNVYIGPLASVNAVINTGANTLSLVGRLIPQTTPDGLAAIQTIFNNFLSGSSTALRVVGTDAQGPIGEVPWLTSAFKTLTLDVTLPGSNNLTLIQSISLKQISFDFTRGNPYSPISSSNDIEVGFKLPFGFPLSINELQQQIIVDANQVPMAVLNVPWTAATTDLSTGIIKTSFSNVNFAVEDSNVARQVFDGFIAVLTLNPQDNTFYLSGSANAKATTAVGDVTFDGLKFDVPTTLTGFKDFGGAVTLSDVKVIGGNANSVILSMNTQINNPSLITIAVGDINFGVYFPIGTTNVPIGTVYIKDLSLVPGANNVPATFYLTPGIAGAVGTQVVDGLLSGYMAGTTADLLILGSQQSTNITSLQQGFAGIDLKTSVTGIQNAGLIQGQVYAPAIQSFVDGTGGQVTVTLHNPLDTAFSIVDLVATVRIEQTITDSSGSTFYNLTVGVLTASFNPPFTVDAGQTRTTDFLPFNLDPTFVPYLLSPIVLNNIFTGIPMNIVQKADIKIGDFQGSLVYAQNNILTTVDLSHLTGVNGARIVELIKNPSSSAVASSTLSSSTLSSSTTTESASTSASASISTSTIPPSSSSTSTSTPISQSTSASSSAELSTSTTSSTVASPSPSPSS